MTRSMTGFGRAAKEENGRQIAVEIKSVNNRYLDCFVRLPRKWAALEERIKPFLQSRGFARGKVDVSISLSESTGETVAVHLDEGYLAGYLAALTKMRDEYRLTDDITVMNVAKNPSVFAVDAAEPDLEADWEALEPVLAAAADANLAAREREGAALTADLLTKLQNIRALVDRIEGLTAQTVVAYRERLAERVREALADNRIEPDESRLLTEVALFADRVAVDEELVRLRTHFCAMESMLEGKEPVGRKLDFLLQEMNREINTTGSKCNDAAVAALVVEVKYELEKMREQIQNLE
ncbi:MAG: YicC family protein [Ruminococcaceae bacterium]|nr:YicC family protein [Oscillospiraceae bacterium]